MSNVCLIISRILAFAVFAIYVGPVAAFLAVVCHILAMSLAHAYQITVWKQVESASEIRLLPKYKNANETAKLVYTSLLNGMSNIFLHNHIGIFEGHRGENLGEVVQAIRRDRRFTIVKIRPRFEFYFAEEESLENGTEFSRSDFHKSTRNRQLCYYAVFLLETCFMLGLAYMSDIRTNDPRYSMALDNIVLTSLFTSLLGTVLKCLFYLFCHPWSDLVREDNIPDQVSCFGRRVNDNVPVDEADQEVENQSLIPSP